MKIVMLNEKQTRYGALILSPLVTYTMAAMAATWWVDGDPARGFVFGVGLLIYASHFGVRSWSGRPARKGYVILVYVLPTICAAMVGLLGFIFR